MKGIRITAAIFIMLMLLVPMISIPINANMQQKTVNYSYKKESSTEIAQTFRLLVTSTGKVENISAFDYICGVVAAEMPASFHLEALKAQAVASFTYACYKRESNLENPAANSVIKGADLTDDSSKFEAYISKTEAQSRWGSNFSQKWGEIEKAVSGVRNKVMVYNGRPIAAVFFSLSSGKTESSKDVWGSDLPYLSEVDSHWDQQVEGFETRVTLSEKEFQSKIKAAYSHTVFPKDPSRWIGTVKRSGAGGVISAVICGNSVKGGTIRQIFGLRSPNFSVSYKNSVFTFVVKGNGHGVGMSQHGADYLASRGENYQQILTYYYKGIQLTDYQWNR
ncbi:MAG TPA: stage II sporulation protein D [Clostridia bacterium]|nr:stage II sporulation protein D [Clostridia bacterium]